jgi:CBS domain-containing protein
MLVREVMTTSPVTVRPGTTVQATMQLAAEARVTSTTLPGLRSVRILAG